MFCALDEKSPWFRFAEQSDGGRVGRQSFGRVRVYVDSSTRLPIVVKGSGYDEIRSAKKCNSSSNGGATAKDVPNITK